MKLDGRYEIRVVVIQLISNGRLSAVTGDCYDDFNLFRIEHPYSGYRFGFIVYDTETGHIPEYCNDWNDTVEEAIFDWQDNCL